MAFIFWKVLTIPRKTLNRGNYQLSAHSRYATRDTKSKKIITILQDFIGPDLTEFTCLDVGCSNGGITNRIAEFFQKTIGIDIDFEAIMHAKLDAVIPSTFYSLASGDHIPYKNASYDVVICAQVYEHTEHQQALSQEIWRILKSGGICFFSGPNRLKVMEEHYWLPFLSWMPRPLANLYMRIFRRGKTYDACPLLYWQLRRLWQGFEIYDYTPKLIKEPERFAQDIHTNSKTWVQKFPNWLIQFLAPIYPNYNWILIKRDERVI